jgi:hypothetical protein
LFGDIEIPQSEAQSWSGKKLWAWPSTRGRLEAFDNYNLVREGTIWIGGPASSELHDSEDEFYSECERLIKQVVSRMIKDFEDAESAVLFSASTIQRADLDLSGTKFIGCEFIFNFHDPEGFDFHVDDWNLQSE